MYRIASHRTASHRIASAPHCTAPPSRAEQGRARKKKGKEALPPLLRSSPRTHHATAINLAKGYGLALQQLLKDDLVRADFSRGDANLERLERLCDGRVPKDVVRGGRLFNPPRVELCERLHIFDGLGDVPPLVCYPCGGGGSFDDHDDDDDHDDHDDHDDDSDDDDHGEEQEQS